MDNQIDSWSQELLCGSVIHYKSQFSQGQRNYNLYTIVLVCKFDEYSTVIYIFLPVIGIVSQNISASKLPFVVSKTAIGFGILKIVWKNE